MNSISWSSVPWNYFRSTLAFFYLGTLFFYKWHLEMLRSTDFHLQWVFLFLHSQSFRNGQLLQTPWNLPGFSCVGHLYYCIAFTKAWRKMAFMAFSKGSAIGYNCCRWSSAANKFTWKYNMHVHMCLGKPGCIYVCVCFYKLQKRTWLSPQQSWRVALPLDPRLLGGNKIAWEWKLW